MKKIVFTILLLCVAIVCNAQQQFKQEGKTFKEVKTEVDKSKTEKNTGFTFVDDNNVKYDIYISKNGRCYVYKTSSKTGNKYKYYLKEELSREICKQLNVEYKEKVKKN